MISNISFELSSIFTVFLVISLCFSSCSCIRTRDLRRNAEFIDHTAISRPQPRVDHARMMAEFANHTAISDFRIINRKSLGDCPDPNPYIRINVSSANAKLSDDQFVTVTISGVLVPAASDWVAMISPANSDVSSCPLNGIQYQQTGDFSILPLLCHYPVKAQYASSDPGYLACKNQECQQRNARGDCVVKTCSATLQFHVINIRTDIEFVFFAGGFITPCILKRTTPTSFANPKKPLYGHLSSIDSTGNSMRVTWVSGDKTPQKVQYGNGKSQTSVVTTFSQADMCSSVPASPAKDFGWHDPGYVHSAVMTGLQPSTTFSYRYGSNSAGWSDSIKFKTPPAGGADEVKFISFGDMGKAPRDPSLEHYIQVSGQCQGDIQGLMQQCARYVQKSGPEAAPSKECCDVVKNVDLACVCQHVTDQVEKIISMEKAVAMANSCGKALAHGTKCGSYTVP